MENHVHHAKLSCEVNPATGPNGENASCQLIIEGSPNDLLNAYTQITAHLFKTLIDKDGKDTAMGIYASVQMEALKTIGIDPEEEVKEKVAAFMERKKRIDALMSILGKTFTEDGKEVKDGDEE